MGVTIMTNNTIITIGRQFGSGGHEIAEALAEKLHLESIIRTTWNSTL